MMSRKIFRVSLFYFFCIFFSLVWDFLYDPRKEIFFFFFVLFSEVFICRCCYYYYYLQRDKRMHPIFCYFLECSKFFVASNISFFINNQWMFESRLCSVLFFKIQSLVYTIRCFLVISVLLIFVPLIFMGGDIRLMHLSFFRYMFSPVCFMPVDTVALLA